jgi:hypothetical protein
LLQTFFNRAKSHYFHDVFSQQFFLVPLIFLQFILMPLIVFIIFFIYFIFTNFNILNFNRPIFRKPKKHVQASFPVFVKTCWFTTGFVIPSSP